eukprot:4047446-Pyramimonas_sp.AAC.1
MWGQGPRLRHARSAGCRGSSSLPSALRAPPRSAPGPRRAGRTPGPSKGTPGAACRRSARSRS